MTSQDNMALWRDCIHKWYPEYESKAYFVPPVVITRIQSDLVTVAGQSVFVPQCNPDQDCAVQPSSKQVKDQRVQDSDTREDLALEKVLFYLRKLVTEQSEPMFVISRLPYSGYLGEPCYAAAAKLFSRPQNLPKEHRRGDFDILIIHRHYGIITGKIKSVLSYRLQLSQSDIDRAVTDRVRKAIKQLNTSEVVLREITKDLEPNLAIRKLIILPYVTAHVLRGVVSSNKQLQQDVVTCLQAADLEKALQYCLLAENLFSSGTETVNVQTWWSTFSAFASDDTMTPDLYLDLLARFCGPATTLSVYWPTSQRIEIRTEGQGVAITGERMTSLVLTPEQISLLTRAPSRVMLTGPPGVGKTVMLVLMALTWLRQVHNVHLVSVGIACLAVTRIIEHMIKESLRKDPTTPSGVGSVWFRDYDFHKDETDVDKAIDTLTTEKGNLEPYVICDEFWAVANMFARYCRFVTHLCTLRPQIYLWAASIFHKNIPEELQEEQMTIPLRCPPAVMSEVQSGIKPTSHVHPYKTTALTTPCDGPEVIILSHKGVEHVERWPLECEKCGQSIADILQRLGLGEIVPYPDSSGDCSISRPTITTAATTDHSHTIPANVRTATVCPPLRYCDVFVLTRSDDLRDVVEDKMGRVTSPANGVVRGLRAAGIPVHVIRRGHESTDLYDMAVAQSDAVTVACYGDVYGLERKVVVWLPGRIPDLDDKLTDEDIDIEDRLHAMSRCTAQLVVVEVPRI